MICFKDDEKWFSYLATWSVIHISLVTTLCEVKKKRYSVDEGVNTTQSLTQSCRTIMLRSKTIAYTITSAADCIDSMLHPSGGLICWVTVVKNKHENQNMFHVFYSLTPDSLSACHFFWQIFSTSSTNLQSVSWKSMWNCIPKSRKLYWSVHCIFFFLPYCKGLLTGYKTS